MIRQSLREWCLVGKQKVGSLLLECWVSIKPLFSGDDANVSRKLGVVQKAYKAKVAIFACPLDTQITETKGTVLIHNANEMLNFSKGEEKQMEQASQLQAFWHIYKRIRE